MKLDLTPYQLEIVAKLRAELKDAYGDTEDVPYDPRDLLEINSLQLEIESLRGMLDEARRERDRAWEFYDEVKSTDYATRGWKSYDQVFDQLLRLDRTLRQIVRGPEPARELARMLDELPPPTLLRLVPKPEVP